MSPVRRSVLSRAGSLLNRVEDRVVAVLSSGTSESPRPQLNRHRESNVPGLFIIGDIAGAPVIKMAMEQGYEIIDHIASLPNAVAGDPEVLDVLVVGAGASGLNAALEAKARGLSCAVLEKEKLASTIENFPEGKWVYAEPDSIPPKGKLWLDGATKEDLLARWHSTVSDNGLDVQTGDGVTDVRPVAGGFLVTTEAGRELQARRVILAIGQRGNTRKLGVPGEERENVYHRLYSPKNYEDEDILVVGGGNSAVEAALTLSETNRVVLSYRGDTFARIFKDNQRKLDAAVSQGRIEVILQSDVRSFGEQNALLHTSDAGEREVRYDHAFVLIGAALPLKFLKRLGVRMEGEWTGSLWRSAAAVILTLVGVAACGGDSHAWSRGVLEWAPVWLGWGLALGGIGGLLYSGSVKKERFAWLGVSFLLCYTIYGAKVGSGSEFWPFRGWGYTSLSLFGRPWAFWYTVLYTALMTVFGVSGMKRWGFDHRDRYQVWRYTSLMAFQWIFFFIIPEYLFQVAVKYQWVGSQLAGDPQFTGQAWRAYGIVYAWPLFFYTFFYDPHQVWVVWGVILTVILIPVLSYFHGKRYCTWICGCGGLAETLGDRWRIYAPKGKASLKLERMAVWILVLAVAVTGLVLVKDTAAFLAKPGLRSLGFYRLFVDVWLVGIIPVALYPFMGGKVWCRYWCPLAKMMQILSHRMRGRFKIEANDKCIACYQCSRYCQVGIPVMQFAMKQEAFGNWNSSCIGCGICVTVCPMDTLSFRGERTTGSPGETVGEKTA